MRATVITCSDKTFAGQRIDRSGPAVRELLQHHNWETELTVVPDDIPAIEGAIRAAASAGARLIVTTGGTGIAPRDVTPEATLSVSPRLVPGFGELMRSASLGKTPMASLSRAQAVTFGTALIVNLPGSVSGAVENLQAVLHLIPHALELLSGDHVEHSKETR